MVAEEERERGDAER